MNIEAHRWWSPSLGHEMGLRVYGWGGQPTLVFPSQGGGCFEYEAFGMVDALRPWIDSGRLWLVTVDGVDLESWCHPSADVPHRSWKHGRYEAYILDEVVPFMRSRSQHPGLMTTGCSMGAYHASNFFFRHPLLFDTLVSLSGVYQLRLFLGDYVDDQVYLHSPLLYLANLRDPKILESYRSREILLAVGQGAWEEPMLTETLQMGKILADLKVPAWVDVWGHDVCHDWPWWRQMIVHFMTRLQGPP